VSSGTAPVTAVSGTSPVVSSGGATPAISLSAGYGDTLNPYASKTANTFLAAPNAAAGVPTFRAIVAADIPTLNQNTTGTAANVTGTVAIANGGTGGTTAQAARNNIAGAVTSGQYLRGNGTNVLMSAIQAADVPTLNQNTTGSAATLTTARTINGVSFNGSANITVTANTTNTLTLGTGLGGTSFNGSAAVTATVSYGTSAGTACQGNDSRLSDSRQATNTNTQLASLGVGTAASGTAGQIRATGDIVAHFSDDRLKTKLGNIEDALAKVRTLSGFYYVPNETAQDLGYQPDRDVGVSAQQVQAVQPEATAPAPIDEKYLTVRYERLVPLLIEAIKELDSELQSIKQQLKD